MAVDILVQLLLLVLMLDSMLKWIDVSVVHFCDDFHGSSSILHYKHIQYELGSGVLLSLLR